MSESVVKVNENGVTFADWMKQVNRAVETIVGLSADDLPDWHYWDSWDSGDNPGFAAREVIENACDDMCMDSESFGFDF